MNEPHVNQPPQHLRELVDAVNRAKDEAAYSVINLGKRLCELKEACRHGEFTALAEEHCGLTIQYCRNLMQIYRSYGQKETAVSFSNRALLALSKSPDPQAALEEAVAKKEAGEDVTAKMAKEIAELHKEIERQKKAVDAASGSLDKLIPELLKLHKNGTIPIATAIEFSKLDAGIQSYVVLPKFQQVHSQQVEINRLKEEKSRALERESQAREARESLQADYDAAVEMGAQAVIAEKELEIRRKEKELETFKIELREEIEKKHTAMITKKVKAEMQEELEREASARDKAERKLRQEEERAKRLVDSLMVEEQRAKAAEDKLKASHPIEKDGQHARAIGFIAHDLKATIEKLKVDCDQHQRRLTDAALQEIAEIIGEYFGNQQLIEMEG